MIIPAQTIGSVLKINIEGVITPCIIIDIKFKLKSPGVYCLIERYLIDPNGGKSHDWPTWELLSKHRHDISYFNLDLVFLQKYSPWYEILIGDQKAWLILDPCLLGGDVEVVNEGQ